MISLKDVSKWYGQFQVLTECSTEVKKGEVVVVCGPSGSGKSTLIKTVNGLEPVQHGEILVDETKVNDKRTDLAKLRAKVGMVFQHFELFPHLSIIENLTLAQVKVLNRNKEAAKEKGLKLLERVGLSNHANKFPAQLSGGQQQRVAIARTLAPKPKVLFMDEPLSNLDAKLRGEMRTELKRLHKDTGSTFVYVTHDQLEAMTLATRICLIETGVLQQYEPPLTVYNRPANLFVADFVGNPTMNFIKSKAVILDPRTVDLDVYGVKVRFHAEQDVQLNSEDVVLGIRPEFLDINKKGKIQGRAFAALPAGMETTVKIELGGNLLSSVKFGAVNYKTDETIHFDIAGDGIILFDALSKRNVSLGSVEIL